MKAVLFCFLAVLATCWASEKLANCNDIPPSIPKEWITMKDNCTDSMRKQVQEELFASLKYLAMGAHFSKDKINRPGFAKLFFDSASEEREHAIKVIEYLSMRGKLTEDARSLIKMPEMSKFTWQSGEEALKDALILETKVTNKIRDVIVACEADKGFNDYHLVDYLTGDFLDEQYKGQREIAGRLSTLTKMMAKHSELGEFLFDKKLLQGEI